jgi:multiple sugar transport system substrate-binding protein
VARRHGSRLKEEQTMITERRETGRGSRGQRLLALVGGTALVLSACGGSTATPSGATPSSGGQPSSQPSGPSLASPSAAGYTGLAATISYSIWGDPAEIKNQQAVVDAFHAANPKITVKVTVSDWDTYWDKLQTGLAGGDAPDVFAMDGPLFPDYQTRDVLLDLKPLIDRDGYDLGQLADAAVADFTTAGDPFGLPRDLNVVALYYNKAMFDAAGVAYPDDTWDWSKLVEAAHKLTLDANKDGKPDQWGFYTETSDMENYWSSLVWQNGGDILAPDGKSTVLGSDQAVGGIQFLQDLIWKEKVMPDPTLFRVIGDAFEQGKAAMEANGSWLVATHLAAGINLGIAPLPKGPVGRATSINPTGAVVYAKTKSPDAAWEFVKYLASPPAQTKLMELRASLPANKEVLAGPYASSFDGAKVLADAITYAHLKPSFKGYNDFATTLQTELDTNVFNDPTKTVRQAIDAVLPALNAVLASQ